MCCSLHEEPEMLEENFVRLIPAASFSEAYAWCEVLLDAGVRCRVICERLVPPAARVPVRAMLPVIHAHPDDLMQARRILKELSREVVLPFATVGS